MTELLWGFVGSIIGAVAAVAVGHWLAVRHANYKASIGILTSTWLQVIQEQGDQLAKQDQVICRHIGNEIIGSIKRVSPPDQSSKSWEFRGIKRGSVVFLIFWSIDPHTNPNSYGTIQLTIIDENHLSGFYIKRAVAYTKKGATQNWKQFDTIWTRSAKVT